MSKPPKYSKVSVHNIQDATAWFQVMHTTKHSQTAVMNLAPGQASGDEAEAHPHSDQVLLVMTGAVSADIGRRKKTLQAGDFIIIPAGARHRFINRSSQPVSTFNLYSPPAYPPRTKG